jgi:uncharacterized membrane protein
MTTDTPTLNENSRQKKARLITLVLLITLISILFNETIFLAQLPLTALLFLIAVKTLPLILCIPALRKPTPLTPVWFSLLLLPYFCWAILGLWAQGSEFYFALTRSVLIGASITTAMIWGWRVKNSPSATASS